jgi:hypothetical protein
MPRRLVTAGLAVLLAGGLLASGATAASASNGSTPVEVTDFIATGLVAQLTDLYGPDGSGGGIDFASGSTMTSTSRVFLFTDDFLAGAKTDAPVHRINEWATVVSVAKKVVGVATVDFTSGRDGASLAGFVTDPALAAALPKLGPAVSLVHDAEHAAWFSLAGTTLTPIVAGKSPVSAATPLASYPRLIVQKADASPVVEAIDPGVAAGGITLLLVVVVIALILFLPRRKRDPLP